MYDSFPLREFISHLHVCILSIDNVEDEIFAIIPYLLPGSLSEILPANAGVDTALGLPLSHQVLAVAAGGPWGSPSPSHPVRSLSEGQQATGKPLLSRPQSAQWW